MDNMFDMLENESSNKKNKKRKKEKTIDERINYLRECDKKYEIGERSPLTDAEYDVEYNELKNLVPDHEYFLEVGGEVDFDSTHGAIIEHENVMGSLNKCHNVDDVIKWLENTVVNINSFIIQPKIDGLSISCIYKNGILKKAVTRGDGYKGIDVTKNFQHVEGIPFKIKYKRDVEIRGECYKDKKDFFNNWVGEYVNPRNFASGSLNQKDPTITKERNLSFIAYNILTKDFDDEYDKIKFLRDNNFKTFMENEICLINDCSSNNDKCNKVFEYMNNLDRKNLSYEIDGVVIKVKNINKAKEIGSTDGGRKPKHSMAVKYPAEQIETTLKDIEFNVGRTGSITIVGILDPVQLSGTSVKRVSLHNFKFIKEMGLKLNSKILIQKSGDIIPYVVKKTEDGNKDIPIPAVCPSCKDSSLEWDENNVTLHCVNTSCSSVLALRIDYWLKTIGVKGIGKAIVERMINKDESIDSIYTFYESVFVKDDEWKEEFGKKAYQNIKESLSNIKDIPLDLFIKALGIDHIGSMSRDIVFIAPSIKEINDLTVKDISELEGFGTKKAESFVSSWKKMQKDIAFLSGRWINIKEPDIGNKLKGIKFCFTGSFSNPNRKEMEKIVEENGGKCCSVSKNLDYLVWDGEISGEKYNKAIQYNVNIIYKQDFLNMLH